MPIPETTPVRPVKSGRQLVVLLLCFLLTGCAPSRIVPTGETAAIIAESGDVEPLLQLEIDRWEGTPHVLGGSTGSGIDCSAFVQRVFADAFRLELPRTTEEQVEVGRRVNQSELQAGDLVFFQPPTKTNHVGIYLNEGKFAHVSSTSGVTVSELDQPYWRTAYWTSRRILPHVIASATGAQNGEQTVDRSAPVQSRAPARRVGW